MSAYFRRVSPRLVDVLVANPARVRKVLFPSTSETVVDDDVQITIERWEALGLDWIRDGGVALGTEAVGDGPARGFGSAEVRTLAARLTVAQLEAIAADARVDFGTLRDFVVETAKAEAALIVYLG